MILEIDAGNTRIKWRLVPDVGSGKVLASGFTATYQQGADQAAALAAGLAGTAADIGRIRVGSVRTQEFNNRLAGMLRDRWQVEAEFAAVTKSQAGVANGYTNYRSMGVDRWLAMLAAFNRAGTACGILDFGSATTFDWIDARGSHRGGYIVPGLHLMLDSLVGKSPALDVTLQAGQEPVPGHSTSEAIGNGLVAVATGFANHCHGLPGPDAGEIRWFLTGGDARQVAAHLAWPHEIIDDLVLDGLALALP